ncbi:hypothetical protein [Halobacteriovorax sp.]|uniref:hypothetical protein n=1 Tax=Halobacteriovorax sp. TaxID=2020862 RepID=UPI0035638AB4
MDKFKSLFFALTLILLSSCASMLVPPMHSIPSPDIIPIHKNPKVGDYAIYDANSGAVKKRFEVVAVDKKTVTMRYKVIYEEQEEEDIQWFYRKLNLDGKVVEAWFIEGGKRSETPIAKSGEMGSFENFKELKKPAQDSITIHAGKFKVDSVNSFIYRLDLGIVSSRSTHFDYLSESVPFLIVKSEILATSETGPLLKTWIFIDKYADDIIGKNYFAIYDLANEEEDPPHQVINVLIEYGFGN